jgi:hypothetical protein
VILSPSLSSVCIKEISTELVVRARSLSLFFSLRIDCCVG